MSTHKNAYLVGGGIGSLAAAAFMIRDGRMPGEAISIFEASPILGGSLDGAGDPEHGYSLRGGRMLTTDNYECMWDLYKTIPSLDHEGQSVFDETVAFNEKHKASAMARLVDRRRAKVPVTSMGFSMADRVELLKLSRADEDELGASCITDWLSPGFFESEFWFMWATTFAFQPWHSAVEFKRYLHRFMLEFSRIETLAGVKRTVFNQYDSLVLPLQKWLQARGVHLIPDCKVTDLAHQTREGKLVVTAIHCVRHGKSEVHPVNDGDLVVFQNGSMTDASSLGSMTSAPRKLTKADSGGWTLWEKLAAGRPELGNPAAFNGCVAQSPPTVGGQRSQLRPRAHCSRARAHRRRCGARARAHRAEARQDRLSDGRTRRHRQGPGRRTGSLRYADRRPARSERADGQCNDPGAGAVGRGRRGQAARGRERAQATYGSGVPGDVHRRSRARPA